jgi:hypothetical protein
MAIAVAASLQSPAATAGALVGGSTGRTTIASATTRHDMGGGRTMSAARSWGQRRNASQPSSVPRLTVTTVPVSSSS